MEYKAVCLQDENDHPIPVKVSISLKEDEKTNSPILKSSSVFTPHRAPVIMLWSIFLLSWFLISGHFHFDTKFKEMKHIIRHEKCIGQVPFNGYSMEFKECWESTFMNATTLPMSNPRDILKDTWFHFTGDPEASFTIGKAFYTLLGGNTTLFPSTFTTAGTSFNVTIIPLQVRITWTRGNDMKNISSLSEKPTLLFVHLHSASDVPIEAGNTTVAIELSARTVPLEASVLTQLSAVHPNIVLLNQDSVHSRQESASRLAWLHLWQAYGTHDAVDSTTSILAEMTFTLKQRAFLLLTALLFILWQPYALSHLIGTNVVPKVYLTIGLQEVLLRHSVGFMFAVTVAMFADLQTVFPTTEKIYSRAGYYMVLLGVLALAWTSRVKITSTTGHQWTLVLNREQTEEWKGWLQLAFILYHYMGGHEGCVYYPVRVYVACYVWLTGFGNYSFFMIKRDFTFKRIVKMIIRINLLIVVVTIALPEVEYMRYYICPLHTIYFLMVWLIMRVQYHRNEETRFMMLKLTIAFFILVLFHQIISQDLFYTLWTPLYPLLSYRGSLHEWKFRFALDGYATWFGMVCAFTMSKLKPYEIEKSPRNSIVITLACAAVAVWMLLSFPVDRKTFVPMHRFTSLLPITAYVILRNSTSSLREWYLPTLGWIGRHSLEIYILQCQLFMDRNGEAHLSWSPTYPIGSLVINSMVVFFFAKLANEGTLTINNFLVPSKETYTWIGKYRILPLSVLAVGIALLAYISG